MTIGSPQYATLSQISLLPNSMHKLSDVEVASGDDGVGPAWTAVAGDLEPAALRVGAGARVHERNLVDFAEDVQHPVCGHERPLSDTVILPEDLASQEVHADQGAGAAAV